MIYLDDNDLKSIDINWGATVFDIEKAVYALHQRDFSQPLKPYLRFGDPNNRIISMPAYVGGQFNIAGLKWIASFPGNLAKGIARAHSVMVLNNPETGEPIGIINTARLSSIRTASVTGLVIQSFLKVRKPQQVKLGIIGFGPIGQYHLNMCSSLLGDLITDVFVFDLKGIHTVIASADPRIHICSRWEEAYQEADIFMTCTTSSERYINAKPKPGSVHINVSLRDYQTIAYDYFKDAILVDDWEEVCRENTDIEKMHLEKGLQKEHTHSISDMVVNNCIANYSNDAAILFNPMGMAVFDLAIAKHFLTLAELNKIGKRL